MNDGIHRGPEAPAGLGGGGDSGRRRPGTLSLRGQSGGTGDGELLDHANKSLADALRLTLRLVYAGMVILACFFVVSGSEQVQENERGVKLLFGSVTQDEVQPGLSINPPPPMGELIKVDVGQAEIKLDTDFWIFAADRRDLAKPIEQLAGSASPNLTPGQGGYNLTSDGNIAHTQWKVLFKREDAAKWARNVLPEQETAIVTAAVRRGVVHSCSKVGIDDLLKQTSGGPVASLARQIAQDQLDGLGTGIRLQQLLLEKAMPPLYLLNQFAKVQSSVAESTTKQEATESAARTLMATVAGESADTAVQLIDEYEKAIEGFGARKPDAVLSDIHSLLSGQDVRVGDRTVRGMTSGAAASIVAQAKQYRSEEVTKLQSEFIRFTTKLGQFQSNPSLMVATEINDAVLGFMSRPGVQATYLPGNTERIMLTLSRDPGKLRDALQKQREREGEDAQKARMRKLEEDRFKPKDTTTSAT